MTRADVISLAEGKGFVADFMRPSHWLSVNIRVWDDYPMTVVSFDRRRASVHALNGPFVSSDDYLVTRAEWFA